MNKLFLQVDLERFFNKYVLTSNMILPNTYEMNPIARTDKVNPKR